MTGYIRAFSIGEFEFLGAHIREGSEYSLLISGIGTSIKLSNGLTRTLIDGFPSEDLMAKLFERGFARLSGRTMYEPKQRRIRPTLFMIDFTNRCNLDCRYCFRDLHGGEEIDREMMLSICDYIVRYCQDYGIHGITLQGWGGEPLLSLELIIECVDHLRSLRIRVSPVVQTNGMLLTKEKLELLEAKGFSVGVSIDGCRRVHDSHRVDIGGSPTYERLRRSIGDSGAEGLPVICVCSRNTLGNVSESIRSLRDDFHVSSAKFNIMHPSGGPFDPHALDEKQAGSLAEEVWNALISDAGVGLYEPNVADRIVNILSIGEDMCHSEGCLGGYSFISFGMDGRIYPCETIGSDDNCIGSISTHPDLVKAIEESLDRLPFFKERRTEACAGCRLSPYCRGGCFSSISARAYSGHDLMECAYNKAIYNRIEECILENPETVNRITKGRVMIQDP